MNTRCPLKTKRTTNSYKLTCHTAQYYCTLSIFYDWSHRPFSVTGKDSPGLRWADLQKISDWPSVSWATILWRGYQTKNKTNVYVYIKLDKIVTSCGRRREQRHEPCFLFFALHLITVLFALIFFLRLSRCGGGFVWVSTVCVNKVGARTRLLPVVNIFCSSFCLALS